jgi:hypothetical protein
VETISQEEAVEIMAECVVETKTTTVHMDVVIGHHPVQGRVAIIVTATGQSVMIRM